MELHSETGNYKIIEDSSVDHESKSVCEKGLKCLKKRFLVLQLNRHELSA